MDQARPLRPGDPGYRRFQAHRASPEEFQRRYGLDPAELRGPFSGMVREIIDDPAADVPSETELRALWGDR